MTPLEEDRLRCLALHFQNSNRYARRLRKALEAVIEAWRRGDLDEIREAIEEAEHVPPPPQPLADFYKEGLHTGHPHSEYLELPGDEYVKP